MCRRPLGLVLCVCILVLVTTRVHAQDNRRAEDVIGASGVRVELTGGGAADSGTDWKKVSGGGFQANVETRAGEERFRETTATRISYEPLTVGGELKSGRQAWIGWLQQTLESADEGNWERSVTLTEIDRQGTDGATFTYSGCFVTGYVFPKLDASTDDQPATESFVIQPNGYDFSATRAVVSEERDRILRNNFAVEIAGTSSGSGQVTSVEVEDLVIPAIPDSNRPDTLFDLRRPGAPVVGKMTLRVLATEASQLATWWQTVVTGERDLRLISVELQNRSGEAVRTYHFQDCQLLYYNPGDYDLERNTSIEEIIVVQPQRVEIVTGATVASAAPSGGSSTSSGSTTSGGSGTSSGSRTGSDETAGSGTQTQPTTGSGTSGGSKSGSTTGRTRPRPPRTGPIAIPKRLPTGPTKKVPARSVSRARTGTYYFYVDLTGKKLRVPLTQVVRVERLRAPTKKGARFYLHLRTTTGRR